MKTRTFSNAYNASESIRQALLLSSRSQEDAAKRQAAYDKMYTNFIELRETMRAFTGVTETPVLSNQYFDASVTSNVQSFAGFAAIERELDNPIALFHFLNLIGVSDNRIVLPNLGAENIDGKLSSIHMNSVRTLPDVQTLYSYTTGRKIIPGTVKVTFVYNGGSYVAEDDRAGQFKSPPGVLDLGAGLNITGINYSTGMVRLNLSASAAASVTSIILTGSEDMPGDPDLAGNTGNFINHRYRLDAGHLLVNTIPEMLIGEANLAAMAATQKAVKVNMNEVLTAKLIELYIKTINSRIVNMLSGSYTGDAYEIDLDKNFQDHRSFLDYFGTELVEVDTALAEKSTKGIRATAYFVGTKLGTWFEKTKIIGNFVKNDASNYINDLLGYFNGVPVLRHNDLKSNEGFAVHKTVDGNMAPIGRGMFLPLTDTPQVGNYQNPTQLAKGVYFQEGYSTLSNDLVVKFSVKEGDYEYTY